MTAWVNLLEHSCILLAEVMFRKRPSMGWWPVQVCYQLGRPLPSAFANMSSASVSTLKETPPSSLACLEWLPDNIMLLFNFADGTISPVLKEEKDFALAPFRERSKHAKFTQGKVK